MKLLELLPKLEEYGRIKRSKWQNMFLVRNLNPTKPMVLCNMDCLQISDYIFSYAEMASADDWEIL